MDHDEAKGGWTYPCRCGEAFQVGLDPSSLLPQSRQVPHTSHTNLSLNTPRFHPSIHSSTGTGGGAAGGRIHPRHVRWLLAPGPGAPQQATAIVARPPPPPAAVEGRGQRHAPG